MLLKPPYHAPEKTNKSLVPSEPKDFKNIHLNTQENMSALQETLSTKTIGQIVAQDYRTAQVFKQHHIDYCCRGNRPLLEVLNEKKISLSDFNTALASATKDPAPNTDGFETWPLDLMADYIMKKHHRYVEEHIPIITQYLKKLCKVHGAKHPELHAVAEHFDTSAGALAMHMKKEELLVFPWIHKLISSERSGIAPGKPLFGTVAHPIAQMMQEHDDEGERFRTIATLTHNYTVPKDACNTYKVTFSLLKAFEDDLHRHIHLENNILFPKAEVLERKVMG